MQNLADLEGTGYYTVTNVVVGDDSTTTVRTTYIDSNATVPVNSDDEVFANAYVGTGKGAGVDYFGFSRDVTIDLNYDSSVGITALVQQGNTVYDSVTVVRGSDGVSNITGSAAAETIYAGTGNNTITGGAGRDSLIGASTNKYGSALFVFNEGDGKDTISGFEAVTANNSATADRLQIDDGFEVRLVSGNVRLSLNSNDQLTMVGVDGQKLNINDRTTAIGDELTFEDDVQRYIGLDDATVTTGDHVGGVNVWMNIGGTTGFDDLAKFDGVKVFDASAMYDNATIVGSDDNNVIYAGRGINSLWGGSNDSNDTLFSGEGATEVYYLYNNGKDVVNNAKEGDLYNLFNIGLEEIDFNAFDIDSDKFKVGFNDGGSLTINGTTTETTFQLKDDGEGNRHRWSWNRTSNEWRYRGTADNPLD